MHHTHLGSVDFWCAESSTILPTSSESSHISEISHISESSHPCAKKKRVSNDLIRSSHRYRSYRTVCDSSDMCDKFGRHIYHEGCPPHCAMRHAVVQGACLICFTAGGGQMQRPVDSFSVFFVLYCYRKWQTLLTHPTT